MFIGKGEDKVVQGIEDRISEWTFLPLVNQEHLQVRPEAYSQYSLGACSGSALML